jgi:hypothetical protein
MSARDIARRRRSLRAFGPRWAALGVAVSTLSPRGSGAAESAASTVSLRTSLVWIYGDDDVLHAPGDTVPPSPASGIGDRPGYDTLFEGVNSRYTGRENWSELDLDGSAPGFSAAWSTRARLALALDASSLGVRSAPVVIEDVGSFLELDWTFGKRDSERPNHVRFRGYPLNADRERVGELELLGWGGAVGPKWESPYAAANSPVRAGRIELEAGFLKLHVAVKTATFVEPVSSGPAVAETSYGVFGGLGSRWRAPIAVSLDAGHFEHGRLPGGPNAPHATTTGATLRLRGGAGFTEPEPPVGFGMERSPFDTVQADPTSSDSTSRGIAVAVEAAHIVERLWDFDHPGATALAGGRGLAAVAEARWSAFDVRALVSLRNPEFVMRNGSGVFPGQTIPRAAARGDEIGAAVGVTLTVAGFLRPSLAAGVLRPAFVTLSAADALGQPTGATVVLRGPSDVEALPPSSGAVPVLELRPGLGVRFSRLLETLFWLQYRHDYNHTQLVAAEGGALARGFRGPNRLGYGLAARAVW